MTFEPGLVFDCPGAASEVTATWRGLAEEFLRQVELTFDDDQLALYFR